MLWCSWLNKYERMQVNKKKSIRLKNRTKYFQAGVSKTYVRFSSPDSYQSRQIKIEGYESRLYWQFRHCLENDGQTFFYTLTYNDAHMPKFKISSREEFNCFDYEDLRSLLIGGFQKQLLRRFGTKFKYFVGAELGDGKGERGMHNNPHYHILFFLEDAYNPRYPYHKILPEQFRHLVRMYWQGFDEEEGFHDYNDAKFGIAREGENLGLVTDFRACMYCAKYVCKDAQLKMNESKVERKIRFEWKKSYKFNDEFHKRFFYEVLYPMYNIPRNAKHTEWTFTDKELVCHIMQDDKFFDFFGDGIELDIVWNVDIFDIVCKKKLWKEYNEFRDKFIDEQVHKGITEYRNRFCNKCRISHGVGDEALNHIEDIFNPSVQVPSKDGFKNRPLCMYYYRKLYTEVIKDKVGSNIRVLNTIGRDYKLAKLPRDIEKLVKKSSANLDIIVNTPDLFEKMRESDINTEVFEHHPEFLKQLDYLLLDNNKDEILKRYAEYKLIYEDRYFKMVEVPDGDDICHRIPDISVFDDYSKFLVPTIFSVSRSDLRLETFLSQYEDDIYTADMFIPYYQHPYFAPYCRIFAVLDMCSDYWFIQKDNRTQADAEERAARKRFHDGRKLKEFYEHFGR